MSVVTTSASGGNFEAANVKWGREECRSVTFVDDVAGSLTDEYFDLNTMDESGVETQYYVLMSGTTPAADPAPSGKTKIDVTYTDGDSETVIAGLFVAALAALEISASQSLGEVVYENNNMGTITEEVNSNAPSFAFQILSLGIGGDLGLVAQGGYEIAMETQSAELKADQTGELVLGEVYMGSTVSAEMSLIEMSKERWETIVGSVTGDVFTPAVGTRLVGYGTSRLYQNLFSLGGKLILHPIRLAASDKSEDIVFWKSAPKPSSINYSGTDQQGMSVTFVAYVDSSKPAAISLFAQGDHSQTLV